MLATGEHGSHVPAGCPRGLRLQPALKAGTRRERALQAGERDGCVRERGEHSRKAGGKPEPHRVL